MSKNINARRLQVIEAWKLKPLLTLEGIWFSKRICIYIFWLCVFCLIELLSNKQTNPLDKYSQSSVYGDEMYCESNPTYIELVNVLT
jgi:hypothetical protein